ncbi:uncharacterized protein LOC131951296 isoform X2 [Physella acuta]|uniref:uncharacterized protein LOC131951296 isoform X2 n=1 Tax=Physella acuta TaxID=109671 RepID=UPI0027DCB39D|nr:uncharacterized protein LOC131951296 isoform X2 [Physella acuta]
MSKSFVLKRNSSPESLVITKATEPRTKSLPREQPARYGKPYQRSEFNLDGSITRCPVHDPPRSVIASPRMSVVDNGYMNNKSIGKRFTSVQNWNTIYTSKLPSYQTFDPDDSGPSTPRTSKQLVGMIKSKDLKRKMVFDLHEEMKKNAYTTTLEEISDMDRITEICLTTLKSMMESKKHRKYLHHMNNNALTLYPTATPTDSWNNLTNNSKRTSLSKDPISLNSTLRRDSVRPMDSNLMLSIQNARMTKPAKRNYMLVPGIGRILRTGPEVTDGKRKVPRLGSEASSSSDGSIENSFFQKDENKALKMLTDLQAQLHLQEDDGKPKPEPRKHVPLLTPEEALACKWLRLTPSQVADLEKVMRSRGVDPGIHEHSKFDDYDVFSEIRMLRSENDQTYVEVIEEEEDLEESNEDNEGVIKQ